MSCGRLRTWTLWLLYCTLCGCGPAEPVALSTIHLEFGESGTLFYNQAQRLVERGESLDLSVQLPLDIHFNSGDWQSIRVLRSGAFAFGTSFDAFMSSDLAEVEVAGADDVVAVCDGRLFESEPVLDIPNERSLYLPRRAVCSVLGVSMDGRFPRRYELRTIESQTVSRVVFQPNQAFEQTLRIGTDSSQPGYLSSFLTLDGQLTELPLGEGGIMRDNGLVVLSPRAESKALGVWLVMTERRVSDTQTYAVSTAHIDAQRSSALLQYPQPIAYSSAPAELRSSSPWTNGIGFADTPPDAQLKARIKPLTATDRSTWSISVPLTETVTFPQRPFASMEMYSHVEAEYDLIWTSDGHHHLPSVGDSVPAEGWMIRRQGYFRTAECDGEPQIFGYWSTIESCELEIPLHSVLIDECGAMMPFLGRTEIESGQLETDRFVRSTGMELPVETGDDGVLQVGRGAQSFSLVPSFFSSFDLPEAFLGVRSSVSVTEQVYEFQDGAIGLALSDPVLVWSAPWQTVAPYEGKQSGEIVIRSGILSSTLSLLASERGVNGFGLSRQIPLCPDYMEQFFLRETTDGVVLEQLVNQTDEQTVLRRIYEFN